MKQTNHTDAESHQLLACMLAADRAAPALMTRLGEESLAAEREEEAS